MSWGKSILALFVFALILNIVIFFLSILFDGFKRIDRYEKRPLLIVMGISILGAIIFIIWAGIAREIMEELNTTNSFLKYLIIPVLFIMINAGLAKENMKYSNEIKFTKNYKNETRAVLYNGAGYGLLFFMVFLFFKNLHNSILFGIPELLVGLFY